MVAVMLAAPATANAAPCGGTAYAPPFVTGPVSQTLTGVAGHPGYRQGYRFSVQGNVSTPVFVEVKGYSENGEAWYALPVSGTGGSGEVPWGNSLASPAVRAKSLSINGVTVNWNC